jgi:PAS domain S-box-containing protein
MKDADGLGVWLPSAIRSTPSDRAYGVRMKTESSRPMVKMGLRGKLALLVLFCAVPGFAYLLYDYHVEAEELIGEAKQDLAGLARQTATRMNDEIASTASVLRALAEIPPIATLDRVRCSALLRELFAEQRSFNVVYGIRPDGEYVCTSLLKPARGTRSDRDYFTKALAADKAVVGKPIVGRANGVAGLPVALAVRDRSGQVVSVLGATINGSNIVAPARIEWEREQEQRSITWWDSAGGILARWPESGRWIGKPSGNEFFGRVRAARFGGALVARDVDGIEKVFGIASVISTADQSITLGIGMPYDTFVDALRTGLQRRVAVLGLITLVFSAGAWLLAEFLIRRPVSALAQASARIAGGDLSARIPEAAYSGEMQRLALAHNRMADEIASQLEALKISEERFRLLLDGVKDYAILMLDPGGRIVTWNEGGRRLEGYAGAEIIGQSMERFYTPEDVAAGKAPQMLALAAAEGRCEDEGWRVRKDGTRFYANVVLTALRDGKGELLGFSKITRDVTERWEAEKRIRAQLEHLNLLDHITRATGERQDLKNIFQVLVRSLEDSLPIDFGCVCLYDPTGNVLRISCVGVKSEALASELAMGEKASIDVDENGLGRCVRGDLVYEPDIGASGFSFPMRLASGGLRSLVMAPLRSESTVFGVLVVARREAGAFDSVECEFLRQLSEHMGLAVHHAQLYESLQQAYDDLRQTQAVMMQEERLRALGQMASGIAHDVNNALSPVSLYTESLLETEKNLSDRARAYLETIRRAVEDVANTVGRMREFYRQREQQLELAPVDVNQMVLQVLDLTKARWSDMAQSRGVVIQVLTELSSVPPRLMGVESEIRDALTNLVFNAVDAMPEGGTLTLRTRLRAGPEQPAIAVEVADTGIGMNEETRQHCLEPFFTTKGERGTGLGLAMVFGMARRHSCEIEIDSAPGAGTTMRLIFAIPTEIAPEKGQPAVLEVPSRLRLLLIDDDPVLLRSLRDALESDGHITVTAHGGESGIAQLRASLERGESYAAVITDLGMPHMDGRKVAAAVKEVSPGLPVILLTGWGQRLMAEGDIPPHVDRVLAKPPKLRDLREALMELCQPLATGAQGL